MARPLRVLVVEDSPEDAALVLRELKRAGYDVLSERVDTEADLLAALERQPWDIVLSDFAMPSFNGLRAFELIKEREVDIPFIFVSGRIGEDRAAEAMKRGASDYILKDKLARLAPAVERELQDAEARRQRQQMAAMLRFSEEKYRALMREASDAIFLIGADDRIREANAQAEALLGVDATHIVGRSFLEFVAPEHRERARSMVQELPHGKLISHVESQIVRADGAVRWIESSSTRVEVGDQTVVMGIVRDITDRKLQEQSLEEREHQLSSIYNTVADIIFQLAVEKGGRYRFVTVNQAFRSVTGLDHDQVIGKWVEEVIPEPSLSMVLGKYEEAIRDRKIVRWEETSDYPTGRLAGEVSVAPIFDGAGTCTHLVGAVHDVTARKRAEEKFRESEERYRNLVEGSVQGLMIVQDGKFAFCNRAAAKIFGYDSAELTGTVANRFVHPEDLERVAEHRHAILRGDPVTPTIEYRGLRRDGSVVWVESYRQPVVWEGRPAMQSALIDVTSRRQIEQQLEAGQRMETVGRLAGGIAHDFNNILAIISSYNDFVLDALGEQHAARADAAVIKDATLRAAALTRQLLAFSRRQLMQLQTLDLNATVSNLEKMLRRLIGEDIELRTRLDGGLGLIRADESQIEQILMNLVVNARDAMPGGGTLTLETSNKALDENYTKLHIDVQPGNYVMLAVTDTGSGMDEEVRRRVFEPFFTTKAPGKGTGLGLSTVYGIVKQMNGSIFVYSEPDKGTTFKVYFPMTSEPRAAEQKLAAQARPHPAVGTILVIEDDAGVRSAAVRILKREGYTVLEAANGAEGIAAVQSHSAEIHLVLSDVVMPGMSGRELWERLRSVRPIPVLFMSGYTDDSVFNHGILEGDFPFLNKPFTKDSLLAKVREVLERAQRTS